MTFIDRINADLKEAMKAKDADRLRAVRSIKAAILLANTDGTGEPLTDERAIKMLQKMAKQRQDSLTIFEAQGREDLAANERIELEVINSYLPKPMDEAELRTILAAIIAEVGATSPKDMGKVMGAASAKLAGKADNRTISALVKTLLNP